jgi:hypothetical protein
MRPSKLAPRQRAIQPEPEPVPAQVIEEDVAPPSLVVPTPDMTFTFEQYMQLYAEKIRIKEENLQLRRKMIRLEEDLKQWKDKQTTKRNKLQGEELKNAVIDILLNSSLNIESIPDDVEREIYSFIINQIAFGAGAVGCFRKLFLCSG